MAGDSVSPIRILVTGSRDWTDRDIIRSKLVWALATYSTIGDPVLVHGGARGADSLASQVWADLRETLPGRLQEEVHRADWDRYGKSAGPRRNLAMVKLGATVCLAFPKDESWGTRHCVTACERAGIHVVVTEGAVA